MHFLKDLVNNPKLEDPAEKHVNVHRHFYRYSRGQFSGPAIKITQTSTKITLKSSFGYEDLIQEIVTKCLPSEDSISIKGILYTGKDVAQIVQDLGLNWDLKKSKGKTKNYKADFTDEIEKQKLLEIIEVFRKNSYLLLTFKKDANHKVTTKRRLPQPSKKQPGEEDVNSMVDFCTGIIKNNPENIQTLKHSVFYDFLEEISKDWKKITIKNNYMISDIEIPKNIKDSRLLRVMAIRKGKLIRILNIDGEEYEKQYTFTA